MEKVSARHLSTMKLWGKGTDQERMWSKPGRKAMMQNKASFSWQKTGPQKGHRFSKGASGRNGTWMEQKKFCGFCIERQEIS